MKTLILIEGKCTLVVEGEVVVAEEDSLSIDTVEEMATWFIRQSGMLYTGVQHDIILSWCKDLLRIVAQQGNVWTKMPLAQRRTLIRNQVADGLKCGQEAK
jgi:hypothetical protein